MLGAHHSARHPVPCPHCHGTDRVSITRTITPGRRRTYTVPCNGVTRAQVDAERARAGRWIGWSAFAVASIAAGVAVTPVATLFAAAVLR